jgi:hypothetical protein
MHIPSLSGVRLSKLAPFLLIPIAAASAAVQWNGIQFGGFASQGYLDNSGSNDYIGDSSAGTFEFREYAVNASYAAGKFRFGAQVFGQKLGEYGNDEIKLDWATIDYQANQWFGIRAGRVKKPFGLYNEMLDLDSVRPFIFLPSGIYDPRLRDFNASFDGALAYGNIDLKSAGSLDYKAYYGTISMDSDGGAIDYFNHDSAVRNDEIEMDATYGLSLFWNTPVDGLRVGYGFSRFEELQSLRTIPDIYPALPAFAGVTFIKVAPEYDQHIFSAEYFWGEWTFAAEYMWSKAETATGLPGLPLTTFGEETVDAYYFAASRRLNDWCEVGAYYNYYEEHSVTQGYTDLTRDQHDYAVTVRFDVTTHLALKFEVHYNEGSAKIWDLVDQRQPDAQRDRDWTLFATKATFSF